MISGQDCSTLETGGDWSRATNYTECLANINLVRDRGHLPVIVAYTYFCLSVISLLALLLCLYIFCSFRSLSCPRLTVHKHLMVSFILFYFSIIVYLEPYVSFREGLDYRDIVSTDWWWSELSSDMIFPSPGSVNLSSSSRSTVRWRLLTGEKRDEINQTFSWI